MKKPEESKNSFNRNTLIIKSLKKNWRIFLILLIYLISVSILICKHEPWFDEAQTWLLARDANLTDLFFKYLHYEGFPGLFYLILMIPAKLKLPYLALNITSAIIAVAGVFVFLRNAPFPNIIKILFPFSYFIFFQYAVVARNYVLLPILLFLIAKIYRDKTNKIYLFAVLLCLLANTSVHGFLITISLLLLHLVDLFKDWSKLNKSLKSKQFRAFLIIVIILGLTAVQILPIPNDKVPQRENNFSFLNFIKVSFSVLNDFMTENFLLSFVLLFLILLWFKLRGVLLLYLFPNLVLLSLFSVKVYKGWHQGIPFLLLIFVMWISLEGRMINNSKRSRIVRNLALFSTAVVLVVHVYWSLIVSINDFNSPYSASLEVANYIKSHQLEKRKIYVSSFHSISILPYFEDNIFDNHNNGKRPSFFWWSARNNNLIHKKIDGISEKIPINVHSLIENQPDLIIIGIKFPWQENIPRLSGYQFAARFEGNLYWKDRIYEKDSFVLFLRKGISVAK